MSFKLDHVHLRCQDLEAAVAYYQKMFDAEVVARIEARGMPLVRIKVGDLFLALSPKRDDEPEPQSGLHWGTYELGFVVEDVQKTYEELKAKGADFVIPPMDVRPGVQAAFFMAPDGVKIEILHRD
ncbi:MAG: VOC family protein [Proteobacteria bacterium]|nr:VOC family protein [Pseudomonadota bacterium]MBU4382926.1 VOC family protein [Pseudomonadota bacterium]MBU4606401.1 VOC family protein [Pseudomonadota bacterium]MCG2765443.1 VOC family protein [Desulfarculaceae bacterium]